MVCDKSKPIYMGGVSEYSVAMLGHIYLVP